MDSNAATTPDRAPERTSEPALNEMTNADLAGLREVIQRAVDFRGDITLALDDGSEVSGYLFDARLQDSANADSASAASFEELRVLRADSNVRERVPLARIRSLAFTGKDAASGKSWENWLRRYAAKKLAGEAASIESEVL